MRTTEGVRHKFLAQNAYTDDAFSTPAQTVDMIRRLLAEHDAGAKTLEKRTPTDVAAREAPAT
jgi:V/A-type H+-transporting ATPase subunit A